jgi:hypothetical protein
MSGPSWLGPGLAAVMLAVALCCASRLAIWRLRGRRTEPEADALHVLMGTAMAGMLEPRLGLLPAAVWLGVFGTATAWFGWRAIPRHPRHGHPPAGRPPAGYRCAHPAPHAAECAAMCYMLWSAPPGGRGSGMTMPGMPLSGLAGNPAPALVLALFMLGYILWTTDQLAAASRTPAAAASAGASTMLAPRVAACYKIAMSTAMGYMLLAML